MWSPIPAQRSPLWSEKVIMRQGSYAMLRFRAGWKIIRSSKWKAPPAGRISLLGRSPGRGRWWRVARKRPSRLRWGTVRFSCVSALGPCRFWVVGGKFDLFWIKEIQVVLKLLHPQYSKTAWNQTGFKLDKRKRRGQDARGMPTCTPNLTACELFGTSANSIIWNTKHPEISRDKHQCWTKNQANNRREQIEAEKRREEHFGVFYFLKKQLFMIVWCSFFFVFHSSSPLARRWSGGNPFV